MRQGNGGLMIKIFAVVGSLLFLSACSTSPRVEVIERTVYPELPVISHPLTPNLKPVVWDMPRIMDETVVKNTTECQEMDEDHPRFERTCLENPIDPNSNIHIGFDRTNWQGFQSNMNLIREYIRQYKERLDLVNQQREEWKRQNREE